MLYTNAYFCNIDLLEASFEESIEQDSCGVMKITRTECEAFMRMGERLTVSSTSVPSFGICCLNGKIKLPDLPVPRSPFRELLTDMIQCQEYF